MSLDLVIDVFFVEVGAVELGQLVHLFLVIFRQSGGRIALHFAACQQRLELSGRLLVIGHHLLRERLDGLVTLLKGKLARLDFEHVAGRCLKNEVLGLRRDA
ncbi:hypothetical protein D3C80_1393030 [compost metagenome]